jgi:L-ascorbate metabolism protein UlaG (beta-lactamase superfamily)
MRLDNSSQAKMANNLSRRRFLILGGAGLAGGVASLQSSTNPTVRFLRERAAELAKPSLCTKHVPTPASWDNNKITAALLGHATILINFEGLNIITDPVLFRRVGMQSIFGTVGPIRRQACALEASALPKIDLVLLSHAHLDHLDVPSLNALTGKLKVITARKTSDLFADTRIKAPTELGWGEKTVVKTDHGDAEVEAFEVKHWGARWRHDTHRGYNGYIIRRNGKKIIFGGDTAMTSAFKDLRGKGPFEFACMPIGAYNPFIHSHCNPEQALEMANDAGAKYVLPMHYYTFRFGREVCTEPIERLQTALKGETERLGWREAGETFVLKA